MKRAGIIFFALLFFGLSTPLLAQKKSKEEKKGFHEWNLRLSPYFWFVNLNGTSHRPPVPANLPEPPPPSYQIDVSFKELSSSIKFAMMLNGEYRIKRISTVFNYASLILEGSAVTPLEIILQGIETRLEYHSGDISVGYRAIKSDKWELDFYGGVKFVYLGISASTNIGGFLPIEGSRSENYVDPIIGVRVVYRPIPRLDIGLYTDIGGSFSESEINNQVIASASFAVSRNVIITAGYRYWAIDLTREDAIFSGSIYGWVTRIGFQF
jgi:hypothetical protein